MIHPQQIVVMGVSGCGKSSVGRALATRLGWRYIEGDDFHPKANIDKMSAGIPLTDEDRWPWLDVLHTRLKDAAERGESVVLSCSALRQVYRNRLTRGLSHARFVYLKGEREALLRNMNKRIGHFMKAGMLDSQLITLEEPADAIILPCEGLIDAIAAEAAERINRHA
ncbi:MAG TPA: gluconokinase [Kiritimatiellia bacterium]|nr:gluconokinase [Kiritimatiellia bacterium]